jgi:hypothetical protein
MQLHCGINRELLGFILFFINNARVFKAIAVKADGCGETHKTLSNYEMEEVLEYKSNLIETG